MKRRHEITFGASPGPGGRTHFSFRAPKARSVEVAVEGGETFPLSREESGLWGGGVQTGRERYRYRVNGEHLVPDPASRYQPEDVHGPSKVVDPEG